MGDPSRQKSSFKNNKKKNEEEKKSNLIKQCECWRRESLSVLASRVTTMTSVWPNHVPFVYAKRARDDRRIYNIYFDEILHLSRLGNPLLFYERMKDTSAPSAGM